MFHKCQRLVQNIRTKSLRGSEKEQKLASNTVASLARSLQDASIEFKQNQSNYLRSSSSLLHLLLFCKFLHCFFLGMKSREDRSKQFFDVDLNDGYVPDEIDAIYEKVNKQLVLKLSFK